MSVNLSNNRNVGILAALVIATIAGVVGGVVWYEGPLIEEVLVVTVVLLAALVLYDKLLVQ